MKLKKVFQRKETKYLLTRGQSEPFFQELTKQMEVDEFGKHTILSLYFDTTDFQFIQKSMEKPKYKENSESAAMAYLRKTASSFWKSRKRSKALCTNGACPFPTASIASGWLLANLLQMAPHKLHKKLRGYFPAMLIYNQKP